MGSGPWDYGRVEDGFGQLKRVVDTGWRGVGQNTVDVTVVG